MHSILPLAHLPPATPTSGEHRWRWLYPALIAAVFIVAPLLLLDGSSDASSESVSERQLLMAGSHPADADAEYLWAGLTTVDSSQHEFVSGGTRSTAQPPSRQLVARQSGLADVVKPQGDLLLTLEDEVVLDSEISAEQAAAQFRGLRLSQPNADGLDAKAAFARQSEVLPSEMTSPPLRDKLAATVADLAAATTATAAQMLPEHLPAAMQPGGSPKDGIQRSGTDTSSQAAGAETSVEKVSLGERPSLQLQLQPRLADCMAPGDTAGGSGFSVQEFIDGKPARCHLLLFHLYRTCSSCCSTSYS